MAEITSRTSTAAEGRVETAVTQSREERVRPLMSLRVPEVRDGRRFSFEGQDYWIATSQEGGKGHITVVGNNPNVQNPVVDIYYKHNDEPVVGKVPTMTRNEAVEKTRRTLANKLAPKRR